MATAGEKSSCVVPLNGGNFATWKIQIKMSLMKDSLWNVVIGKEKAPPNGTRAEVEKFETKRDRALAILVLNINPSLLYLIGDPTDPAVVWDKLCEQFQKKSWANKLSLRRKLYSLRLRNDASASVQAHVKTMMEIFDELSIMGDAVQDEDKVVHLLASLPEPFDILVTALEAHQDVPKIDSVIERLLNEERKLKERNEDRNEDRNSGNRAFFTRKGVNKGGKQHKGPRGSCWICGKMGHHQQDCTEPKGSKDDREKANITKNKNRQPVEENESSGSEYGFVVTHVASVVTSSVGGWIVDSAATSHMCKDKSMFVSEIRPIDEEKESKDVQVGDGAYVDALGRGEVKVDVILPDNNIKECTLKNVLLVPDLKFNLLSVPTAALSGVVTSFEADQCRFTKDSVVMATGKRIGNLYYLHCAEKESEMKKESNPSLNTACATENKKKEQHDASIWHRRYGHLGAENMKRLNLDNMVDGMKVGISHNIEGVCKPCIEGKHHRLQFPKSGTCKRADGLLDLVHTDVCGKVDEKSLGGMEYFVTFIDDRSRHVWSYPIQRKSDVFNKFVEWKTLVENLSGRKVRKIKTLRSDNGGEYTSTEFIDYLKKEGIRHEFTVPKTPEQNGVAERMNRTLLEVVRSMLSDSQLPKRFWAEALATATYVRNRSPTKSVAGMTPFEAWSGKKPNVNNLRIFGCISYAHVPKDERKKLDSKARECIFLGYGTEVKGYRLLDLSSRKIVYSRDVVFDENNFRRIDESTSETTSSQVETDRVEIGDEECSDENVMVDPQSSNDKDIVNNPQPRERKAPTYYGEWVNVAKECEEPSNFKDAVAGSEKDQWMEAMTNEIESLRENDVWDLVPLPPGRKAIGCKWIYKVKRDADGNIERFKSRLVAQGFSQKYGIDYDETFSPVVRFESIRTIIALAAQYGLKLHQMDVKTAFLNGELKEEIYMRQPDGFTATGDEKTYVCKLKRSLYGLKQSARCWNSELDKQLRAMGFSQLNSDPCVYIKDNGGEVFIIAVYVDDLILGGDDSGEIKDVKRSISDKFRMEDMGQLHHFLGVKVVQCDNPTRIWIGQPAYIVELLQRFKMDNSNPVDTPADPGTKLKKADENEKMCEKDVYQSAVGTLLYLSTRTRPDIAYAVGSVARYSANPSSQHWSAVKRIMRYLRGSAEFGVMYVQGEQSELMGYSDSDWAGDLDDRKSTSGYVFLLSGAAVSWRSKKQSCVALSTAEAEYMALASAAQESVWMERLVSSIITGIDTSKGIVIFEDNQSAIGMSEHQSYHGRTKHVDIKYHFIREQVAANRVRLRYCKSCDMIADILTKALCGPQFKKLRARMGMAPEVQLSN